MNLTAAFLLFVTPSSPRFEHCNYGKLTRSDDLVSIRGGGDWTAAGRVLKDGKLLMRWSWKGTEVGIGLYQPDDNGNWHGAWDYYGWLRGAPAGSLTKEQVRAVEGGDLRPLTRNPDYIQKEKRR